MKTTVTVALILLVFLLIVEMNDMKMKIFLCVAVGLLFRYLMEMNQTKDDLIKEYEEANQLKNKNIELYRKLNQLKDDLIKKYEEENQLYKENTESCEITKSSDERIEKVSTFLSNNRTLKEINEPRLRHEQNFAQGI